MEGAQKVNFEFHQTLNGCVITRPVKKIVDVGTVENDKEYL